MLCGLLSLLPAGASAEAFPGGFTKDFLKPFSMSNVYLSAFLDQQSLDAGGGSSDLEPLVAEVSAGYWFLEGVGLELDVGTGVADDSVGNLDVDFRSRVGLSLRFESPPAQRFAAYALFGYVRTSYRAEINGASSTISLPGGRLALGLTYIVKPQFVVDGAFTHHNLEDDARINSFRIGVRYELGSKRP